MMIGEEIHDLAKKLFSINRSITGDGVRKTLNILREICPSMSIHEVPSGTKVFDWDIPNEWNISKAYLIDPDGKKIIDFADNNLHVLNYSIPINTEIDLQELENHIYSLSDQPDAIPYVTSYYSPRWGFCLSHKKRQTLKSGKYKAVIESTLKPGSLTYGEIIIPGESTKEIFISTYVCHPSMANNELSGPCVTIYLAKWLQSLTHRKFTYRIVFIPETIGSITYLSKNLDQMKQLVSAGFNVTCIGDDRSYSYLPSRNGHTISDEIAKHVLKWTDKEYKTYSWRDRGSDERQYCAPGVDLPIATIMRTKYGQYPEYHTSLDNLTDVVTPSGLEGGFTALKKSLEGLEKNCFPIVKVLGEPQLGKRGLYPTISTKTSGIEVRMMMDLISYSDGRTSLLEIAEKCEVPIWDLYPILDKLVEHDLIKI